MGEPKDSVLGPLSFIIHINSIFLMLKSFVAQFANDSTSATKREIEREFEYNHQILLRASEITFCA